MKKIILCAILVCVFGFDGQSQGDDDIFSGFDRWQVRARAIAFSASPYYYPSVNGVEYDFTTSISPELDISFFFTKKMSIELMLTATKHDVDLVRPGMVEAGSVTLIPPALSFQYHFYAGDFKPYLGIGVSYVTFSGEEPGQFNSIAYKDEFGYLIQGGIDYMLSDKWFINLDFKKMFLKTEITVDNDPETTAEANLDPIIAGLGVGIKF